MIEQDTWQGRRCGHNYEPDKCPYVVCDFKAALARLATVEAERADAEAALRDVERSAQAMADRLRHNEDLWCNVAACFPSMGERPLLDVVREAVAERDAAKAEAESLINGQSLLYEKLAEANAHIDRAEADLVTARAGGARAVECLENIRKELKTIAEGKQAEVWNDFSSGEAHGWWMALQHFESFEIANSAPLAWLAEREAEAVAKWIEKEALEYRERIGEYYERSVEGMLEEAAALRAKGVGDAS